MQYIKKKNKKKNYDLLEFKVISQSPGTSLCLAFRHSQIKLKIDVTRKKIK